MNKSQLALRRFGFGAAFLLAFLLAALMATNAQAQEDPPGRVGRLTGLNGSVSWWDDETGQWADAEANRPLTTGDRVSTASSGRAEVRVGSTVLRLSNSTELEIVRLDDERLVFQLRSGSVALRVRSPELASEVELLTDEARLLPQRAGLYRLDRNDDTTQAGVWQGELRIDEGARNFISEGQRAELYRLWRRNGASELRIAISGLPNDGFSEWVLAEDRREERSVSARYVSPEMTGVEDLDRHGRWEQHPEFGAVWQPLVVSAGWAPYREGRWVWVRPWGWTWVDEAPWGFAPFHYGRWVSWRGRWGWVPGAVVPRPVFAPALVAWVGGGAGGRWGVSVQIGSPDVGGRVGWVPLAPREVYRPQYRSTPVYVERVNPPPRYGWQHPPSHVPTGPVMYGNQGVPQAVTVVPRDVLTRRLPVGPRAEDGGRRGPMPPLAAVPAPPAPLAQMPAEGGRRPERERERERGPQREPLQPVPGGAVRVPQPQPQAQPQPERDGRERREPREAREPRGESREPQREPPRRGNDRPDRPGRPYTPEPTAAPTPAPRAAPVAVPAPAPGPAPAQNVPVRPALSPPPAAVPAPPRPAANPAPAPRPEPERPRERDDERKRRPDAPGSRDRENLR